MAEASIKFKDKKAQKFFKDIIKQSRKVEKRSKAFTFGIVAKHVIEDVTEHFEDQQGGPSKLWPEWSEAYLKHMRKIGRQGNNILTFNARMRNSFGPNKYRLKGSEGIEFFNPAKTAGGFPYAAAHNEGGPKLPQRKFMWLSAKARNRIARDTLKFISGEK